MGISDIVPSVLFLLILVNFPITIWLLIDRLLDARPKNKTAEKDSSASIFGRPKGRVLRDLDWRTVEKERERQTEVELIK